MLKKSKLMLLGAIVAGGTLFQSSGCLGGFWDGFLNGFPTNNRTLNVLIDVLNEELFG